METNRVEMALENTWIKLFKCIYGTYKFNRRNFQI